MTATSLSLEERLARQEAAEEVRSLVTLYAEACDSQDLERLRSILAPDVELSVPGASWSGVEPVLGFFRDAWAASPYPSRHFITNVAMRELDADRVASTAYFLYVTTSGDDGSKIGWGSYRDRYMRHDGALRLHAKYMDMDLLVDVRDGWGAALRSVGAAP
jgi:3-phenylpropionate/cinnamic acid dioxygenase small subunit